MQNEWVSNTDGHCSIRLVCVSSTCDVQKASKPHAQNKPEAHSDSNPRTGNHVPLKCLYQYLPIVY